MIDSSIIAFDKALRTLFAPAQTIRPTPGALLAEPSMDEKDRQHAAALMRINHCGEICAQALYQGQALMSHDPSIRQALKYAAEEETEHLAWTEQRIKELGSHKSLLNPLWYGSSLAIGLVAGKFGDRWNLSFLAETELQVEAHLKSHLESLPKEDQKSRAIVEQMKIDEAQHAITAKQLGAHDMPRPVKATMKLASKIMTKTAYYL